MILRSVPTKAVFSEQKMGKADLLEGEQLFSGLNCFLPGQKHALHVHPGQDKLYFVLEGQGDVTIGDATDRIEAGDMVIARQDISHALENPGPDNLVVLAVFAPPPIKKTPAVF